MRHQWIANLLLCLLTLVLFSAPSAHAYIELNGFYATESLSTETSVSSNRMFFEGAIGFRIDKRGHYLVGWNYSIFSTTDSSGSETTYSSTQMGPRFVWVIDRKGAWSLGLAYNIVTNATFKSGDSAEEKWKGTALKVDFGYNFKLSDEFLLGLRLNYSSASYTEKLIGSSDYSEISINKTLTYPSIYSIYMF